MEYKEAIKLFKDHDYWAEISYIDEACITAIPVLEKQIPKSQKLQIIFISKSVIGVRLVLIILWNVMLKIGLINLC